MTIANNINVYRKANNMTQEELAGALKTSIKNIGAYEEGRAQPSIKMFIDICQYFEVDPVLFATKKFTAATAYEWYALPI